MVTFARNHCRTHFRPYDYTTIMHSTRPRCHLCLTTRPTKSAHRTFSCSVISKTHHYQTLSVPRDATKNQIKLSKLYHPDVAKDLGAKEKFQAVSEAYAILGDDRRRRAYDKTLGSTSSNGHPAHHASSYAYQYPYDTVRRRGATHAWSYARTSSHAHSRASGSTHKAGFGASFESSHPHARRHSDPFASPNVQKATGRRKTVGDHTEADRVTAESSFWRAIQVIGVVLFVVTVGGGFGAVA
ncbi:unnamed protein product [Somion occarium]|uniref:J domain-containing protein n=1 Tax=Somion occarium TaxID=3059160 RepID=A0ABP1CM11_9APHY